MPLKCNNPLTAGGGERRAALRGHPQVRRARVEYHVEHLGWRADANLTVVLSLLGAKPEKFMTVPDFPKAAKADCFDAVKMSWKTYFYWCSKPQIQFDRRNMTLRI